MDGASLLVVPIDLARDALLLVQAVDEVALDFGPAGLVVLNVAVVAMMFAVALDVRLPDLRVVFASPRPLAVGLVAQFLVLPAATFALTRVLDPAPAIALGMILVGSCPGGTISNAITHLAKGNAALSIGMSGVSTMLAVVATPANFAFWGSLDPGTRELLRIIVLDPLELGRTLALVVLLPVLAGLLVRRHRATAADALRVPMRIVWILLLASAVVVAILDNLPVFAALVRLPPFVLLGVLVHNGMALSLGYGAAAIARLGERDRRAVSIEVGIQSTSLALLLIFNFLGGLAGMVLVAMWWGIWHLVSGLALARYWSRRPPVTAPTEPVGPA